MMRTILILFFIGLFGGQIIGQSNLNQTDEQGRRTGKWVDYHANGKKRYEGTFKEGYEVGTFRYYNSLGILVTELIYSQKGEYADAKIYYNDGKIKAEGRFHQRKKDGVWKYYAHSPYYLAKEESYKDGVKDGRWRIYYPDGQLSSEVNWKDGLREGPWLEYFENGNPRIIANFKNGKLHGLYEIYILGNIPVKRGSYYEGDMNGIWYFFDDQGYLIKKERWYRGFLQQEADFKDGKLVHVTMHTTKKFKDDFTNPEIDGE
jgi:antitoxin component YwqK of YwqJK toxin-antitoxin module